LWFLMLFFSFSLWNIACPLSFWLFSFTVSHRGSFYSDILPQKPVVLFWRHIFPQWIKKYYH
jgi:hypothetical protein